MFICLKCHRHVRAVPCPFCGEERAPANHLPGPAAMRVGISRAALLVGALSGAAAGCGETPVPDDVITYGDVYGVPPDRPDGGAEPDVITAGDVYGLPADRADPVDIPVVTDAAVYGIPPDVITAGDVYGVPADR